MSGSKLGRGGGRGTGRMVVAPPPPLGRGMAMPMRRQGIGPKQKGTGLRKGRLGSAGGSGLAFVAPSQEESFQVLSVDQGELPFAMAIRLTPEVLEDLKRAEAEDIKCEMKFGVTPSGHVIKVGDEEYKFSSAPEPGDLCDIYEEQWHGEDGNGVLKEAGSVWRKLSVLRILNASEKDRVKNRSKEAERQQKSRKAIILDPTHSIVKNQGGTSGDVNGRRVPVKPKKEPPKKMLKALTSSPATVGLVTKPKPVVTTASLLGAARVAKAASVTSPELLPSIEPQTAIIPPSKGQPVVEERDSIPAPVKASLLVQNNNTPSPATTTSDTGVAPKAGGVISPSELRNSLITLLTDNPKGLTIKAVEKAFGEAMPHVKPERKTIEKAIKVTASYHAPGKYMLKEGVSFAKPSPCSGSSPEIPAADTPPLVDSPANVELAPDAGPEPLKERIGPGELGLLGERPGVPSGAGERPGASSGLLSSFTMQRCSGDRVSRAIRKADEKLRVNAERSQQSVTESMISSKPQSVSLKEPSPHSHESAADAELISIRGDGSPEQDMIEAEVAVLRKSKHRDELAMDSPEGEEKMANSGSSDTSSSSDSGSDTDSDSHSGTESHSGTSRSGSGSDSDSDGSSSSNNEDENMDEDVEIMSEDEEKGTPVPEDSLHLRPKTKDKKQASHQAKEKRLKFTVSDKIPISHDSEAVDIVGDEATGQVGTNSTEKAIVAVEVLDNNMEVDVDVVSVDGGVGSPQEWASLSPPGLQRQQENLKEIEGSEGAKSKVKLVTLDKNSADSDRSLGSLITKQNGAHWLKKDDIESNKQLDNGGESQWADKDSRFAKSRGTEKDKAANLRGHGRIGIHNSRLAAAKTSPVQSGSPFRSDMASKSILESPAVNNDGVQTSCQPAKESIAKRRANPEFLKTFPKDAGATGKTVMDLETGELGERTCSEKAVADKNVGESLIGVLNKPLQRSGKGGEKPNPLSKQPVEIPQRDGASRNAEVSSIVREAESVAVAGRRIDAEAFTQSLKEPEGTKRVPRDLNLQNNPEAGLLRRPGKDLGNRQLKTDMDPQGMQGYREPGLIGRPVRDQKQARRQSLEPEVPQQNESFKETDARGKPMKDIDMTARTCNDGEAQNSSFRDGRKMEPVAQEPAKGTRKIDNNDGVSRHNEKRGTESSDLELGELQESTLDVETWDQTRKDGTQVEAVKGREIVERANKPLVHKGQVSPPKDKAQSTGKSAGDLRKDSPMTTETQKPILLTHKEVQRVDQVAAREIGCTTTGVLKPPGSISQEDKLDAGSALKSRLSHSESAERPQESRGLKRLAEDGDSQVYKKPSVAPVPPLLPVNRSVQTDMVPVNKFEKTSTVQDIAPRPPNAESNRGCPLDVSLNHAQPSSKASNAENGQKQRPYVKGQEDPEKEGFERQGGQESDQKSKVSVRMLGPGDKIRILPDSGQSNGKWAKLSGSSDDADEKDYFLMYEKNAPELRGPAVTYEQAEKYKREYEEKYIIYRHLHDDIEDTRLDFATFKREIERASNAPEKLQQVRSKIQMTYHAVRKRSKRMQKTFNVLHDELLTIKQHLKDFAEKAGQE